jgi:hypothetical protein
VKKLVVTFRNFANAPKKGKVTLVHAMKAYEEGSAMALLILSQGATWNRAVSITSQPHCYREITAGPIEQILGHQSRSERFGEEKVFVPLPGLELLAVESVPLSLY